MFKNMALFSVLLCNSMSNDVVRADDMTECLTSKLQRADDSMTIGELRASCRLELQGVAVTGEEENSTVVSDRLREDREHVLAPFTLMAHKPNYMLLGAYNASGYDSEVYQQQYDDPTIEADDIEAQIQLSIKTPLAIELFDLFDIYAAYTNRSFWQVYNSERSAPFREINHEPEIWAQFRPNWSVFGFTNVLNAVGFVHQSNGQGSVLSRSWNRVYANFIFERDNFGLAFKPWHRLSEDKEDDDNPDITDYLGHYEIRGVYKWEEHVFSAMSRNNLESGFSKGAVELGWSFPLGDYPYVKGYLQYFGGYGESLIDYDQYANRIGIGFILTDFL